MKEATGELNMTVITVVAIAAVGALFTFFVWPNIQANLMLNTACSQVSTTGNYTANGQGNGNGVGENGNISCTNFLCTATYQGRSYTRNCRTE